MNEKWTCRHASTSAPKNWFTLTPAHTFLKKIAQKSPHPLMLTNILTLKLKL